MEEKKTILDYIGQIFMLFGLTIFILNIFCMVFGESAKELSGSNMFSMGREGLSVATMMQFFSVMIWITLARFLFFTDTIIKNMRLVFRTVGMVISVIITIAIYVILCNWFPIDEWQPWVMFFVCFAISFCISLTVTVLKERTENRKMEEALARLKEDK